MRYFSGTFPLHRRVHQKEQAETAILLLFYYINLVTVHSPCDFDTILFIVCVNSNIFAHKMLKSKHFGA